MLLWKFYSLSFVTEEEYIRIIASLKHDIEDNFKCKTVDKFDTNAKHYEYIVKAHKIKNFCDGETSDTRISPNHVFHELEFRTCPCSFHTPQVASLIELEGQYNKFGIGSIYKNGNMLDAPAKLISAFRCIRAFLNDYEKKQYEKAQKEAEMKMAANKVQQKSRGR